MLCLLAVSIAAPLSAYSVLTHEAIIDTVWDQDIRPLLLRRFPRTTPDELVQAHAYAYGGCIIQDMGYYPFGSKFFSDLVHYVRSGDFIVALLAEAHDLNEYAFALGALAHYAADDIGHPLGVNPSVAIGYPKLKRKFGPKVTYEDDPAAHLKTEFGFDVLEVARGNYAPKAYHDFVGFEVSKPVLERAFLGTYSLELKDVFSSVDLALGTYRHTVSSIIPEATRVAWDMKKDDLVRTQPSLTREKFTYNLSRASYEKEWGRDYRRPGIGARILSFLLRLIPKVGPFRAVSFKPPTPQTAQLFMESFNRTLDLYRKLLREESAGHLQLVNRNFDTGLPTRPGTYHLADGTYGELAQRLAERDPTTLDPKVRQMILAFFADPDAVATGCRHRKDWVKTLAAVARLRVEEAGVERTKQSGGVR